MNQEFTPLICPQCGGTIRIDKGNPAFVSIDDDIFMFVGMTADEKIACQHCKTEFVRTQRFVTASSVFATFNQQGQTVHGQQINVVSTGGGAYIRGDVNTGGKDFVGRDVIINGKRQPK